MTVDTSQNNISGRGLSWISLPIMMLLAVFLGIVASAAYVGFNNDLRLQIKNLLNISTDSSYLLQQDIVPVNAAVRSGVGVDGDTGGTILLSLDELEHFIYMNIETNLNFAKTQAEIMAYGDELRLTADIDNLITFDNVGDEIQRPGSPLELMMRSFYQVLDSYNNTDDLHLPCLVMNFDEEEAREIFVQLRIPPGPENNRVIHEKPYVVPAADDASTRVTCYFPPQ
ncbi:MAG: hypothetical protein ACPG7F_09015 [Aggregatilineales bacterium]